MIPRMVDRDETITRFEEILALFPDVQRKGAANPYTSYNGNMFSFVTKEGAVALRLDDDAREQFMKKHGTGPVIQYGATMRGYVEVPAKVLANTRQMKKYFADSVACVHSLPAKPTTQKKATKKKATQKATAKK